MLSKVSSFFWFMVAVLVALIVATIILNFLKSRGVPGAAAVENAAGIGGPDFLRNQEFLATYAGDPAVSLG
jgi:hypothetical protein